MVRFGVGSSGSGRFLWGICGSGGAASSKLGAQVCALLLQCGGGRGGRRRGPYVRYVMLRWPATPVLDRSTISSGEVAREGMRRVEGEVQRGNAR
jgi:hypothetical protein